MQAKPDREPRMPASAPTLGYRIAMMKGPMIIKKFIIKLIFCEGASYLPVTNISIYYLWQATIRAMTDESEMKRQVRTTQAEMSEAGSM